ncbi:hypothetical protein AVEN_192556-1 [Araneus ventricosus]|uniref:Uncharacterized protein n=1 Tax=Araneus ventricosus TaxID=182803 RepID=A0A4Y2LDJ0_ARAVE|nr:hypothetical protein AVEN_192556-1 [Araneus ventricosus]
MHRGKVLLPVYRLCPKLDTDLQFLFKDHMPTFKYLAVEGEENESTRLNMSSKLFCICGVNFAITTSQPTCFASGLVDYALLLCRKFAAKLPHQVCHDKLISRKIELAASVHAIWDSLFLLLTSIIQKWKTIDMRFSNELLAAVGQVVRGFPQTNQKCGPVSPESSSGTWRRYWNEDRFLHRKLPKRIKAALTFRKCHISPSSSVLDSWIWLGVRNY